MDDNKKVPFNRLQKSYLKKIDSLKQDSSSYSDLLSYVLENGDNYVAHRSRNEARAFDESWIDAIMEALEGIDHIIASPRTFIKEQGNVVLAALAKRVSSASVTHLASHSQFIHGFDDDGNVVPEKILSMDSEEDYQTYENRLVMSLIMKLSVFVQNRYRYIKEHGETRNSNVLVMHSTVTIEGKTYEVDNRIRLSEPSDDEGMKEQNDEMLAKVETMSNRVTYYLNCPFMKKMKGAKIVHNPINMTNLLEKNPDYKKVVKLWRFIDSYNKLGIEYNIVERNEEFTDEYMDEVTSAMVNNMLTLTAHQTDTLNVPKGKGDLDKKITPKTLLNLDDITFLDGKFQYTQFPEIKERWEETLRDTEAKFKKDHPLQAPSIEEVKKIKEIEKAERQEEIIYARDIHIAQENLREKWSRAEDRAQIDRYRRFNSFLDAEQKRLDEIEAKDQKIREEEKQAYIAQLNKESEMYEDSLIDEMRRLVAEEAARDRALEELASYRGGGGNLPLPKAFQHPGYASMGQENAFGAYPYYGEVAPEGALSANEDLDGEPMEIHGEPTDDLTRFIRWADRMAKKAVKEVKKGEYKTDENLLSRNPDGSSTYKFQMETLKQ